MYVVFSLQFSDVLTFHSDTDWYDKDGNLVHAFMTRRSPDVDNPKLRFKEMAIDVEIRDRFIAQTSNVLDPKKMRFWSLPENVLQLPLGLPF
jgi:Fe-S-cluster formation regulator IscX/YfhJ